MAERETVTTNNGAKIIMKMEGKFNDLIDWHNEEYLLVQEAWAIASVGTKRVRYLGETESENSVTIENGEIWTINEDHAIIFTDKDEASKTLAGVSLFTSSRLVIAATEKPHRRGQQLPTVYGY